MVTTEALDAWCPPTFNPSGLGRDVVGVVHHLDGEPQHTVLDLLKEPVALANGGGRNLDLGGHSRSPSEEVVLGCRGRVGPPSSISPTSAEVRPPRGA